MNGIEKLTGWAAMDLKESAYTGVDMMIKHYDDIDRIAERFCNGNRTEALADIFEKGLQAMLDMCDLDDKMSAYEETKQEMMCAKRTIEYLRGHDQEERK